ncbi:hypothetical protein OAC08_03085 [Pelagibacterales bacterium]|nr:hypothetical protein [Pelagibacterales bacterium]|tara:strand:+ start:160 stop:441 length:282 start_codon:yes stop_codon:yes gene_type:complete
MKLILKYSRIVVSIAYALFALYWLFNSYFVRTSNSNIWFDGLGRQLYETPFILKWFGHGYEYAGWYWWSIDMLVFWGGIGFLVLIWQFKSSDN